MEFEKSTFKQNNLPKEIWDTMIKKKKKKATTKYHQVTE